MDNSESRFQNLYNSMNQGVVYQDLKGEIIAANPAAEKFLGLSLDQMQGRKSIDPRWKSIRPDGSDFPGDEHPAMVSLKTGKPVYNEVMGIYHPLKDYYVWILVSAEPIINEKTSAPIEVFTTFIDITDQIIAEKRLMHQSKLQALLTEISSTFINTHGMTEESIINASLEKLGTYMNVDRIYIFDYDHENELTSNTFEWCKEGIEPQIKWLQDVPYSMVPGWVEAHKKGLAMNFPDIFQLDEDDGIRQVLEPQGIKSIITVPIFNENDCIGFVGVDSVIDHKIYGDIDEELLRIYAQLLVNLTIQVQTKQNIERNQRFLDDLFQSSGAVMVIKDLQGKYLMVNRKWEEVTGHMRETVLGKTDFDLFSADVAKQFFDNDQKAIIEGRPTEVEEKLTDGVNNSTRYFKAIKFPVKDFNNQITGVCGIISEITEKRKVEAELKNTNARLLNLVNSQTNYVLRTDLSGILIYANRKYNDDFGWLHSDGSVLGNAGLMSIMEYHHERTMETVAKCLQNPGTIFKAELDKPVKNGGIQTTLWEFVCLVDNEGNPSEIQCMGFDITNEKRSNIKLEQSQKKYKTLFDDSPTAYLILKDDIFVNCNKSALNLFNGQESDIIGKSPADISPPFQDGGESSAELVPSIYQEIENNGKSTFEWTIVRPDGSTFLALITASLIDYEDQTAFLISWDDITKEKETYDRNKLLSEVIEQSPMYVRITDPNGIIEYANTSYLTKIECTFNDILGRQSMIWSADKQFSMDYEELKNKIKNGEKWNGEISNTNKNGEQFWENIVVSPVLDTRGRVKYFVEVSEDITIKKEAEKIQFARKEMEAANEAKNRFLSNMSHEIRTPLQAIMGYSHILKKSDNLNAKQAKQINSILRSGNHLVNLIEDILQFSIIESGKLTLNKNRFKFSDLLNDIKLIFEHKIEQKGTYLHLPEADCMEYIYADEGKIRQVLLNIIGNAVKFTSIGGTNVEIKFEEIDDASITKISVTVSDTGPGMTKDELENIFIEFKQFDLGMKEGGTGLGMSISYHLIKEMNGDISLQSTPGKGTTVNFHIMVQHVPNEQIVEYIALSDENNIDIKSEADTNKKILIVDDNEDNRETLRDMLEPRGYLIFEAIDGLDGVIKAQEIIPDLVLMDIRMPNMDGYEASGIISKSNIGASVKIIAVTASEFQKDEEKISANGIDGYLRKPYHPDELYEIIELTLR